MGETEGDGCIMKRLKLSKPENRPTSTNSLSDKSQQLEDEYPLSQCKTQNQSPSHSNGTLQSIQLELEKRREVLRQLKMVKLYRKKNNLTDLQNIIDKWREVSREAVEQLCDCWKQADSCSIKDLLETLKIDARTMGYEPDDISK